MIIKSGWLDSVFSLKREREREKVRREEEGEF